MGGIVFYFVALIAGCLVGMVASSGALLIHHIAVLVKDPTWVGLSAEWAWIAYLIITVLLCVTAAWLVAAFAPEAAGSGIPEIEGYLAGHLPVRWHRVLPVKYIGSALSIGANMVLGREGPAVQMGGAVGAMMGELGRYRAPVVAMLVSACAGSGISAAFNAPLAGVMFVLEEMHDEFRWNARSVGAVIIACAGSTTATRYMMGTGPAIVMQQFDAPGLSTLWMFALFGLVLGGFGLLYNKVFMAFTGLALCLSVKQRLVWCALVALCIAILGMYFAPLVGEGYVAIHEVLKSSLSLQALIAILLGRFILLLMSYSSGVPGGIFAPMLSLGSLAGIIYGRVLPKLFGDLGLPVDVFVVAGMGGLFAASIGAPLTGILLIIEMTQNYHLVLPLMVTCLFASGVTELSGGFALYTGLLSRKLDSA